MKKKRSYTERTTLTGLSDWSYENRGLWLKLELVLRGFEKDLRDTLSCSSWRQKSVQHPVAKGEKGGKVAVVNAGGQA